MNKLLFVLLTLLTLNSICKYGFAEVNIDLLKQKYTKCEDVTYRDECFDDYKFSTSRNVGYFRNNALWDGLHYQNNILILEFNSGKLIYKSFCKKNDNGWTICPSGNRYKPLETGYLDKNKKRQGKFRYEYNDGSVYVGEYIDGKKNGQGTFTWKNGDSYAGEWLNGKFDGQGTYTYSNGIKKEGIWKNDKFLYPKKKIISKSNSKLEGYKNFCSEIGLTPGTEKFGECVVEAMKKG